MDIGSKEGVPSFIGTGKSDVASANLVELKKLIDQQRFHAMQVHDLKSQLKDEEEKLRKIESESIPEFLDMAGVTEIKLPTGEKVIVKDDIKASVSKANMELFYNYLKGRGEEDIIKASVKLVDANESVVSFLAEHDIATQSERTIHHQTLGKYVRMALESGQQLPEFISVFNARKTTIK